MSCGLNRQSELLIKGPGSLQQVGDKIMIVPRHLAVSGGLAEEHGDQEREGELEEAGGILHIVKYVLTFADADTENL